MSTRYNVLVVWADGTEEYVAGINGRDPAIFTSASAAQEVAEGFRMGMDSREVQSVNVVKQKLSRRRRD